MTVHLDFETYSSVDLRTCGTSRYLESSDFEVLLLALSTDGINIRLAGVEELAEYVDNESVIFAAHNASFERQVMARVGYDLPASRFRCSMIHAAYAGLPMALDEVGRAIGMEADKSKMSEGKALIRYFCQPCKPTKANGYRTRNLPEHDPSSWELFKEYCRQDVRAEIEIANYLNKVAPLPYSEIELYALDQSINQRGVRVDLSLAKKAIEIAAKASEEALNRMQEITGVDNPNSGAQLKTWLEDYTVADVTSLTKATIPELMEKIEDPEAREVLSLRLETSKTSIKKYKAMLDVASRDQRARNLFQFNGAGRTGRWSGRLIQLQNLPRNFYEDLDLARRLVKEGRAEDLQMLFGDTPGVLSQLVRTALIPSREHAFAVADFSAIEARVIAWLAGEAWRLKVFATHGKIYEASASKMFHVPISEIGKGSELRQKGKVAELALGYQGATGALIAMGADKMGLSDNEMSLIVSKWREASPAIVALWRVLEASAIQAVEIPGRVISLADYKGLTFVTQKGALRIVLPSGRSLYYREPRISSNAYGKKAVQYKGTSQLTKKWGWVDTYGGKLTENIVQAISRDILAESMLAINAWRPGCIVMHVHDEVVAEVPSTSAKEDLKAMVECMERPISWAQGLPLRADGFITYYYKKD